MNYLNLLCSITCLSFAWSALATDGHLDTPPITMIFNCENNNSPKLGNTTRDRSLTPYYELSTVTEGHYNNTFQAVEERMHNNAVINDIRKITNTLGLSITPLTKVRCNRITFFPLAGRTENITIDNKIWHMETKNLPASLQTAEGLPMPIYETNTQRKEEVTFLAFSDGKSCISFELNGKLPSENRLEIRNIKINY